MGYLCLNLVHILFIAAPMVGKTIEIANEHAKIKALVCTARTVAADTAC